MLRYNLKKWFGVDPVCLDAPSTGDSVADNIIGLSKAKGAKEEREKFQARSLNGKLDKARAGLWLGVGDPPYGYRREGRGKEAKIFIDEREAAVVRRIFSLYTGADGKPKAGKAIAKTLTEEGVPPPARHKGTTSRGWYYTSTVRMLKNAAYIGKFGQTVET